MAQKNIIGVIFIYPLSIVLQMPTLDAVSRSQTIRYSGLFDFDGLYAAVIDWCKLQGYMWHEKTYKHKVPSPRGAEQELEWEMTKNITNYLSHKITISVHSWDHTEVEVDVDGKKKSLTNARIYFILNGTSTRDWQGIFSGSKFIQKLQGWYNDIVYKKEFEGIYNDQFHYRQLALHAIIKKYFDLQAKKYAYKGYLGEN